MAESYKIRIVNSAIAFDEASFDIPEAVTGGPSSPRKDSIELFCRMGDPESLECVAWRQDGKGGIFTLLAKGQPCLYALAENGLAFALALGHFGSLCANTRYGIDIFEEFGEDDA